MQITVPEGAPAVGQKILIRSAVEAYKFLFGGLSF